MAGEALIEVFRSLQPQIGRLDIDSLPPSIHSRLENYMVRDVYWRVLGITQDNKTARTSLELMESSYNLLWKDDHNYLQDLIATLMAISTRDEIQPVIQRICIAAIYSLFVQNLRSTTIMIGDLEFLQAWGNGMANFLLELINSHQNLQYIRHYQRLQAISARRTTELSFLINLHRHIGLDLEVPYEAAAYVEKHYQYLEPYNRLRFKQYIGIGPSLYTEVSKFESEVAIGYERLFPNQNGFREDCIAILMADRLDPSVIEIVQRLSTAAAFIHLQRTGNFQDAFYWGNIFCRFLFDSIHSGTNTQYRGGSRSKKPLTTLNMEMRLFLKAQRVADRAIMESENISHNEITSPLSVETIETDNKPFL